MKKPRIITEAERYFDEDVIEEGLKDRLRNFFANIVDKDSLNWDDISIVICTLLANGILTKENIKKGYGEWYKIKISSGLRELDELVINEFLEKNNVNITAIEEIVKNYISNPDKSDEELVSLLKSECNFVGDFEQSVIESDDLSHLAKEAVLILLKTLV